MPEVPDGVTYSQVSAGADRTVFLGSYGRAVFLAITLLVCAAYRNYQPG